MKISYNNIMVFLYSSIFLITSCSKESDTDLLRNSVWITDRTITYQIVDNKEIFLFEDKIEPKATWYFILNNSFKRNTEPDSIGNFPALNELGSWQISNNNLMISIEGKNQSEKYNIDKIISDSLIFKTSEFGTYQMRMIMIMKYCLTRYK